jgi:hypothetical protein
MIAAGIVAGAPSKGRLWRHDPTEQPGGEVLVSCVGSLEIVDLPAPGVQLEFDQADEHEREDPLGPLGTMALF